MEVRDLTETEIDKIADARITDGTPYRLADVPDSPTRYVVRDTRTKGINYLAWGDDDPDAAHVTLVEARKLFGRKAVELVVMAADQMDPHTRRLIEGTPDR